MTADRLGRILQLIAGSGPEPSTGKLCDVATAVTGVTGAGIMLFTADVQRGPVASSDEVAGEVEALQYTLGEGPCLDAYHLDQPVLEEDLAAPELVRWPAFAPAAVAAGVRAIFGFPLRIGSARLGSLNLYRGRPGHLDSEQHANALVIADVIAQILLALQGAAPLGTLAGALTERADFGYVIHQASGMVSVQLGISVPDAVVRLRAYAFRSGRRLGEVAHEIVAGRLRFGDGKDR